MKFLVTPSRLKISQFQRLAEKVIIKCKPIVVLQSYAEIVEVSLKALIDGVHKEQIKYHKKLYDYTRDFLGGALYDEVDVELKFPNHPEEVKAEIEKADVILTKYGREVFRKPYDQESIDIDNMLDELLGLNQELLEQTHIVRWIPLLTDANNSFKSISDSKIDDELMNDKVASASAVSTQLKNDLDALFVQLFSQARVTNDPALLEIEEYLTHLIAEMK